VKRLVPRWAAILAAALVLAGIVLGGVGDGAVDVAGFAAGGLGLVVGIAVAFYAVGRSEDLDRERRRGR
jgi:uncharacterized membrane protein YccC